MSQSALEGVLADIEQAQQALNAMPGKAGQNLRENEWLMSVRSRAGIPGGTCEFDLPSYHAWLMRCPRSAAAISRDGSRRCCSSTMP